MKLILLLMAIVLAGCGATTAPSPSPTPVPTPSAAPTASPVPTPEPDPTRTPDDEQIAGIIRDTGTEILDRLGAADFSSMSMGEIGDFYRRLRDYAKDQLARLEKYTASECLSAAASQLKSGLLGIQVTSDALLSWIAGGAVGEAPIEGATIAGQQLGAAIAAEAGSC